MKEKKFVVDVSGEAPFLVPEGTFAIGPSASGYTLMESVDGETFVALGEAVEADVIKTVSGRAKGMWYKLDGNSGRVIIKY